METPRASIRKSVIDSPRGNFAPLRRSIVASTPLVVNENANDDDSERLEYRRPRDRYVQQQQEAEATTAQKESLPIEYLKQHFDTCLRMAAENKINQKNVWQIHVIDYLETVLDVSTGNTLQLAGAGLEVSAKVYALRVDSVHAQVLKIAGELGRQGVVADNEENTSENEALLDETGADVDGRAKSKPKTKRKKRKTVLADPSSLLGEIEVHDLMDPIFLQSVSKGSDVNAADALFQANMDVNPITSELTLMTDAPFWDSTDVTEDNRKAPDKGSIKIPPLAMKPNTHICPAFAQFSLADWDVNNEANDATKEPSLMQRDDYAFDMDAEPLPLTEVPMDTSHMERANLDSPRAAMDDDEEEIGNLGTHRTRVENIVDLRPVSAAESAHLEYSYRLPQGSVWAGPSYWKLKSITPRPTVLKVPAQKPVRGQRKKKVITLEYDGEKPLIDHTCKTSLTLKKATMEKWRPEKNLLPADLHINALDKLCLNLNDTFKLIIEPRVNTPALEEENVTGYNYTNMNDSNYCADVNNVNDDNNDDDFTEALNETGEGVGGEENGDDQPQSYAPDNLIEAPPTVPKIFVPYSTRAKKIDMKKIKSAVWSIVSKNNTPENKENKEDEAVVINCNFSDIHEKISDFLSKETRENLSPHIEFYALLHVACEHNLCLTSNKELTDIKITKKGDDSD